MASKTLTTKTSIDWSQLSSLSFEDAIAAALSGPGTRARVVDNIRDSDRSGQSLWVRSGLDLTRIEFAKRFGIPVQKLRDWDTGRSEPDEVAVALLRAIEMFPDEVARAQSD